LAKAREEAADQATRERGKAAKDKEKMAAGTQFTCFTGTKVQILTQQRYAEVKAAQRIAEAAVKKAETGSLRPHTLVS
jgi:hypothetical protein